MFAHAEENVANCCNQAIAPTESIGVVVGAIAIFHQLTAAESHQPFHGGFIRIVDRPVGVP